jgi:hypothetical protein
MYDWLSRINWIREFRDMDVNSTWTTFSTIMDEAITLFVPSVVQVGKLFSGTGKPLEQGKIK